MPLAADGTPRLPHIAYDDEGYPHSDGEPLAQNDPQLTQILYAVPPLRRVLGARFPGVYVGSDMFIYPRRKDLRAAVAPDVFVAFGAGGHSRNSYKLFKGEPVPSFAMEVLSSTTADNDLGDKRRKYAAMGIREYWMFDPSGEHICERVAGLRLRDGVYEPIPPLSVPHGASGMHVYRCEVLGLLFRAEGENLRIHDPVTGEDLLANEEEHNERLAERAGRLAAEKRADDEAKRADKEMAARRTAEAEIARLKSLLGDNG